MYQAHVGHPSIGGSHRFEELLSSLIYSACYCRSNYLYCKKCARLSSHSARFLLVPDCEPGLLDHIPQFQVSLAAALP